MSIILNIDISRISAKLKGFESKTKKFVQKELDTWGQKTVNDAKRLAPVDEGHLVRSISVDSKPLRVEVVVAADYAAYIEFGTRRFAAKYVASLPPTWQAYAATFKGKGGGDYFDFLNAILDWVMRKGIANRYSIKTQKAIGIKIGGKGKTSQDDQDRLENAAYAIALSILRNGIKPQPFLFPAVQKNLIELKKRLK